MSSPMLQCEAELEKLKTNPYFDKYAKKLQQLKDTAPDKFLLGVEQKKIQDELQVSKVKERQYTPLLNPKEPLADIACNKKTHKSLNDIMKLDLIKEKDANDIELIWERYHLQKDSICGTVPIDLYKKIKERSVQYPIFILPLPRSEGYEFFMLQFNGDSVHFTTLLCYQIHKENAPECLRVDHFTELQESKNLILMRGEYDKNVLDATEAQCLANEFQLYYAQDNKKRLHLLEKFNRAPSEFDYKELLQDLESISL